MDFDWTTFLLEIVNFLILIWILKRFLYQPVWDIIDKRRAGIDQELMNAKHIEEEAKALKQKNEQFLTAWENEKEAAHAKLSAELAELRDRRLAELTHQFEEEAERRRILDERRQKDYERKTEDKAIELGIAFISKFLSRMATPELEKQLFQLLLEDLANLTESDKRAITEAMISLSTPVVAQSAFPVTNQQREALSAALHEITGQKSIIEFQCTHSLLAGMRIEIGPLILHANLRDELKFFSKPVQHEQ